jgi:3-deoxy-D-manno-octulosonate 8-phosphate phosphatase (KDO 8-P phosphatase)
MKSKMNKIKMILMDVDGVLTDGSIILGSGNMEIKSFNVQDGMGITLARLGGLKTGIITGRISDVVERRAKELKFDVVSQGSFNKYPEFQRIKEEYGVGNEEICYIGDDLLDISILQEVGFSAAPANARDEVKAICDYVTVSSGGHGAVREVVDKILIRQGKFDRIIQDLIDLKNEK